MAIVKTAKKQTKTNNSKPTFVKGGNKVVNNKKGGTGIGFDQVNKADKPGKSMSKTAATKNQKKKNPKAKAKM